MSLVHRVRRSATLKIGLMLTFVCSLLWLHIGLSIYEDMDTEFGFRNQLYVGTGHSAHLTNSSVNFSQIELARASNLTVAELSAIVDRENAQQVVRVPESIGDWPPRTAGLGPWPEGIVIVIQVHDRLPYLQKLLESLSRSRWIERALLVFSHDIHSDELNRRVRQVAFCCTVQIFFPYSLQLHPNAFPGDSPDDCPRNINKEKAVSMGCSNAAWPDLYGHYREARYSQTKHHWWWKTHFVFEKLRAVRHYDGPVVLLEEDHYVAEDFLHALWLQHSAVTGRDASAAAACPYCAGAHILSLGSYPKVFNHRADADKADLLPWVSSRHNMGMAFNRSLWTQLHRCADLFCSVDDYNWDWSLSHVAQKCLPGLQPRRPDADAPLPPPPPPPPASLLSALVLRAPRVFHIGECGVHHRKRRCSSDTSTLTRAERSLDTGRRWSTLFPERLTYRNLLKSKTPKLGKGNGGWGDPRDKRLCLSLSAPLPRA